MTHWRASSGSRPDEGGLPMFVNTSPRYEILSEDAMATLDRGWRRIVSELGIEFMSPWALELLREAGQKVEGDNGPNPLGRRLSLLAASGLPPNADLTRHRRCRGLAGNP